MTMKSIKARKVNMTQVWTVDGKVIPVTVLAIEHNQNLGELTRGEVIDISGISRGRGFAGPMKRHGFHGAPASHGHDHPRAVGSIGQRFPQHTRPGLRMAGRMGGKNSTVKHSVVVAIDEAQNLLIVKGGVPGAPTSIVEVKTTGIKKELPELVEYKTEDSSSEGEIKNETTDVKTENIPVNQDPNLTPTLSETGEGAEKKEETKA